MRMPWKKKGIKEKKQKKIKKKKPCLANKYIRTCKVFKDRKDFKARRGEARRFMI